MQILQHSHQPVAHQVSPQAAAQLQNKSSGLAILLAFFSAGLFVLANLFLSLPIWGWAIPTLCGAVTVGLWLFLPSGGLLKNGALTSLVIFSIALGAVCQATELKVFFAGFFTLWLFNLLFYRLFYASAKWAAFAFWLCNTVLLGLGLYFLPPPWSVEIVALSAGGLVAFLDALHFLWAQAIIPRRHGEHEVFRGAMTCHLEIFRVFVLWLLPNTEGDFRYENTD